MHFLVAPVSCLLKPLPFIVLSFLVSAKFGQFYEIDDPKDQIAEESSVAKAFIAPNESKEVNITLDHNDLEHDWPTTTESTFLPAIDGKPPASTVTTTADPLDAILPRIKFTCKNKSEAYYSDTDFCDIFHYCKSNGYRFTFLCPNDSYYNNQLMACEQNATHLKYCKTKSNAVETVTLAIAKPNYSTTRESVTTQKSFFQTKPTLRQTIFLRGRDRLAQDSSFSAAFESTRVGVSPPTSNHEPLIASETEPSLLTTVNDHLSTSTLIPPALFIEPTASNIVIDDFPTQFGQIVAMTYASPLASSTMAPSTVPPSTTAVNMIADSTTMFSSARANEPVIMLEHKEQSIHNEPLPFKKTGNSTRHINFLFPSRSTKSEIFKVTTSKPTKKTLNNLRNFADLDMSNYEISTEGHFPIFSSLAKKGNHHRQQYHDMSSMTFYEDTDHKSTLPVKSNSDSSKFSLSIHKFFRESLPTNYLKNVPKILRSLNAIRDYEASIYDSTSPTMPRKNDLSTGTSADEEAASSSSASMLSIPVLVPVNLSHEDYRRRMSSSVLKPIVIPLKEKGKLIPAYVLQFGSRRTRRHKRSALNGKRLLSLSIKPNLLYNVLPSLLKNVYIKPGVNGVKQPNAAMQTMKPNYDMIMAGQGVVPMYTLPNGQQSPNLPPAQMANLLKFGSPYDLNEFKYFIPPYYFVDQHPYLHYRPKELKKNAALKRPPLRSKIPIGVANGTAMMMIANGTYSPTTPSTGLMAMASSTNGQAVSTAVPNRTFLFGSLGAALQGSSKTGLSTTYPPTTFANYMPTMFGSSYYSPLLYFGNNFIGSDPSKFQPMMKKTTLHRKLKHSRNSFNSKEGKLNEQAAPNFTMPANIYVPDDILEDIQVDVPAHKTNITTKFNNTIDHKVSNDLMDSFSSDESRPVEVFARRHNQSNKFALRNARAMRDRSMSASHRELSSQTKINANFFNGTSVKVTAKLTVPETTNAAKAPRDAASHGTAYHRREVSKAPNSGEAYSADSGHYEQDEPNDSHHRLNLTSYVRHLKTTSVGDSA